MTAASTYAAALTGPRHLLRHEDQGMMAQFVVVHPGQGPDVTVAPDAANTPAVLDPLTNTHAH